MQIESYFVSEPGGDYLAPTYDSMEKAQGEADTLNTELTQEREAEGKCTFSGGRYTVGAHLADGTSTFEIG